MFIALDSNGNRIDVKNAEKGNDYFCPVCNNPLQVKEGKIKIKHFAHISGSDCDDFSTDMSEWHRNWQEQFPLKNREVVIEHNGEKHRADVLACGHVIEFQHSPISLDEFERRNSFYTAAGKKVVWIFDLIEKRQTGQIYRNEEWVNGDRNGGKWKWSYSYRVFKHFSPQKEQDVVLFFQLFDQDEVESCFERVIWADVDWDGISFRKFHTSYFPGTIIELVNWIRNREEYDLHEIPIYRNAFVKITPVSSQTSSRASLPVSKTVNLSSFDFPKFDTTPTEVVEKPQNIPYEKFSNSIIIRDFFDNRWCRCEECNQLFLETDMTSYQGSIGQCRTCARKKESRSQ